MPVLLLVKQNRIAHTVTRKLIKLQAPLSQSILDLKSFTIVYHAEYFEEIIKDIILICFVT